MARVRKLKASSPRLQPRVLSQGRIFRHQSTSRWLNNSRPVDIYLPPGYDQDSQRHYPVLYMHDGNNLFYPEIAFGGMPWHVDQTLNRLISAGLVEPLIVVGVSNTMGRNSEYTWTRMRTRWGSEGGDGPRYAHYLSEELKPWVDHHLRTLKGPEHTAVMGSSLGGLISFYLGLNLPQVFGHIGMVSPSLWWNQREPLHDAWRYPHHLKLWLDMGTREGSRKVKVDFNPNIRNVRELRQIFLARGYREGQNLGYLEDRGALHNEWWWGQRLHLPLMFFFGNERARRLITA